MEDRRIVELYWSRDHRAIDESQGKYGGYCFAVARNILGGYEDSEECVNDTWLQAWNSMPPHRPEALRMFLARITRSLAFNRFKAGIAIKRGGGEIALVLEELSECVSDETDVEGEVIARELAASIGRFVRELPTREGDIFARRYFFTEPIGAIAAGCGMTENHVSVTLSRTRAKLRRHLEKEGYI